MRNVSFAVALVGALVASRSALADGSVNSSLYEGDYLFQGQRVVADSGYYHLEMQTDGNLVLYAGGGSSNAVWATGTNVFCSGALWDRTCGPSAAQFATLQSDGNFVVYWETGDPAWATNTSGGLDPETAQLWVQQDGNLVEYRWGGSDRYAQWASNTVGATLGSNIGVSSITHIENDVNFAGDDYRGVFTNDPMQCGQWCASSEWAPSGSACNAFTWVQAGTSGYATGVCWLKTAIPAASAYAGTVSGYIRH